MCAVRACARGCCVRVACRVRWSVSACYVLWHSNIRPPPSTALLKLKQCHFNSYARKRAACILPPAARRRAHHAPPAVLQQQQQKKKQKQKQQKQKQQQMQQQMQQQTAQVQTHTYTHTTPLAVSSDMYRCVLRNTR